MQSRGIITLNTDRAALPPLSLSLSRVSASIVDTRYISEEKLDNEQPERLLLLWLLRVRCFDCDS